MKSERVDKAWQSKGLAAYSTPAIFGTLAHYGIELDEARFKALAEAQFPLAIAGEWLETWKGTGQFSKFPEAAAEELWQRLVPDRLMPATFADALGELVFALEDMRAGSADAPVGQRFKEVQALKEKVPVVGGAADEKFVSEVVVHLGEEMETFQHLAERLAREGHVEDAEEVAGLEEFLFPQLAGVAKAVVRAAKGEQAAAVEDLEAIAKKEGADPHLRLSAVDGLIHLGALEPAKLHALTLVDLFEKEDLHLALEVGERLAHLAERLPGSRRDLEQRLVRLVEAHNRAHPDHAH